MNSNNTNTSSIVSKVWAFCNTLRDDGVGYGDYLEQLTYLLFLKMADEYSRPPHNRKMPIPTAYNWESLTNKSGDELEVHYNHLLRELAKKKASSGRFLPRVKIRYRPGQVVQTDCAHQCGTMGADGRKG
jgi:type I restriction enzyme M protein